MAKYSDVRKIISFSFPRKKIKEIKEFSEGYNNVAYDVRVDDKSYVVKLLKMKGLEKHSLKQKKIRSILVKKYGKFPIGKVIKFNESKKLIDKPYIIFEKIYGKSMQSVYNKIENREELYYEIGKLYGMIHSIKFKEYGEFDSSFNLIDPYKNWYMKKTKEVEKVFRKLEERKLLTKKQLEINKEFFRKNKFVLKSEIGPCLCHGDSADSNIIVKKVGRKYLVSGLIDFEFSRSGGAIQDLFKGNESFEKKWKYRRQIIQGHSKFVNLRGNLDRIILFYKWYEDLNRLTQIRKLVWRNLDLEDTEKRKNSLRKVYLKRINEIMSGKIC